MDRRTAGEPGLQCVTEREAKAEPRQRADQPLGGPRGVGAVERRGTERERDAENRERGTRAVEEPLAQVRDRVDRVEERARQRESRVERGKERG